MMSITVRPRAAAAALLAAVLLTGCGSGADTGATGAASSVAPDSASATPRGPDSAGSDPTADPTASGAGDLDSTEFGEAIATAQRKAGSYRFEMTTDAAGRHATGHGEAVVGADSRSEVHSVMEIAGQRIETVLVDGLLYLKAPMFGTDKPWLEVDPKARTGLGAMVGQLGANSDPTRMIGALFEASTVRSAGAADVEGTATARYHVVLPRRAFSTVMGYPDEVVRMMPATIEYDVYVDDDHLVRRLHSATTVQGQDAVTDIVFSDYGAPIEIEAPPAAQVTTKSPLG